MRAIRYLILSVLGAVILWATIQSFVPGNENLRLLAGALLAVAGLIQSLEWLYDRLGPARDLRRKAAERPSQPGTVEDYLHGRRRAFADEERRFVPLALAVQPEYQSGDAAPTDDLEKLFEQHGGRLVLVGDPGAGKSTSLRALMRVAITHYLGHPSDYPIPVWINLGEGANPVDADALLQHWWDQRCYLPDSADKAIRQNHLLLFLDGLNEMPLDSREARAKALREFLERNRDVQVVVTCRVRDYEDDEALKLPLPVVKVLPLDDGRIQQFIERNGGDGKLWAAIQADEALRTLAAKPYNLYQLIQVYRDPKREGETEALPRDLNQLYRRYLGVTYDRYTRKRQQQRDPLTPLVKLPLATLEKRLQRLAFAMLAEGKGTSAEVEWALDWRRRWRWGGQAIGDGLNLGVLLRDGENLRFYHQSLHGYFAIEPLGQAMAVSGGFDRFTKDPHGLIRQIGDLGAAGAPAVEALIGALNDRDKVVRRSALVAIEKIGDARVLEPLIARLADEDLWFRVTVARTLGELGDVRAVEPLIARLEDEDSWFRGTVAGALGELGDTRALWPLIARLADKDMYVRATTAEALGKLGDARAVETLIARLSDDGHVRESVVEALRKLGRPAMEAFVAQLRDNRDDVRRRAVEALGQIGDEQVVEPLVELLEDKDKDVRRSAVWSLGKLGDARAVGALIARLEDEDWTIRTSAVRALGELGDARAVEPLIMRFRDEHGVVCERAIEALVTIGWPAVEPLMARLGDNESDVHLRAIEALVKIGNAAVEPLMAADRRVRSRAVEALGKLVDTRAVELLIAQLGDEEYGIRWSAAKALERIGTEEALAAVKAWEEREEKRGG